LAFWGFCCCFEKGFLSVLPTLLLSSWSQVILSLQPLKYMVLQGYASIPSFRKNISLWGFRVNINIWLISVSRCMSEFFQLFFIRYFIYSTWLS
jgi:hypothetical protein